MIDGITNAGSIPILKKMIQFAGARHRLIANNIANLSTPDFQPKDVSVEDFQSSLKSAVSARRMLNDGVDGDLKLKNTREINFDNDRISLTPASKHDNILFHDGNDRDIERIMQDLVENFMVFRQTSELIKNRFSMIRTAISGRI